ncbi:uncharacterized protein LODBEIA_P57250 [Lodderomyces beijingensis]|uniref:GDS1 winged helix domain-containing protein n=1 Tax=Lodderomyces beijingensis TaxID=1775926 RepID=A0ABP0ZTL6_9ASCO
MALTERRPLELHGMASAASPTFNPNTLGVAKKNRTKSLPLHPTEKVALERAKNQDNGDDDAIGASSEEESQDSDEEEEEDEHEAESEPGRNYSISGDLAKMDIGKEQQSSRSTSPESVLETQPDSTRESTPPTSTSSPPSSNDSSVATAAAKKIKKPKPISRAPIATGISTAIPVTGEKPEPIQEGDASLEDDVLFNIFLILFKEDPEGQGLTVKQVCDILREKKPEMASLSTKTSNLVSAKLNAYIKRIEKGDTSLKYAISRDWADASPKRMVYVYRGILASGFEHVAKTLLAEVKKGEQHSQEYKDEDVSEETATPTTTTTASTPNRQPQDPAAEDESLLTAKQASLAKPRRQTMFDLGITRHSFFESSSSAFEKHHLNVPYSSAPVTAALNRTATTTTTTGEDDFTGSDHEMDEFDLVFDDESDRDDDDDETIETVRKNGKRSKSMSYLLVKKPKFVTAAAAAPRASRAPSMHSANAAAAAAELHAAALRAGNHGHEANNHKWLNVIRSGFLSLDIGAPEDTDIDSFFA